MMRKYILLLLFLCTLSAARGQTYWHYDYWFDNDYSTLRTGTNGRSATEGDACQSKNGSNSFQIEADVSALSEGLHAINIQMVGQSNAIVGFSKVKNEAYSDTISKQMSDLLNQEVEVEVEDVVVDTEEQTLRSVPVIRYFVKTAEQTTVRYWFDNDVTTLQTGDATGGIQMLDVESLKDGFHLLNIQTVGQDGSPSHPKVYPFVKIPQVVGVDHLTCLCMIDDQLYRQEQVANNNGVVAWQFDVASLPQGFHRIHVQVVTPSGAASNLYQGFFFRETTKSEFGEMKCVYAIDGSNFNNVAGTLANGTFHFDLDVSALSDGLHRIAYMLANGSATTKVQTQFFTKIPLGGYGTVEYWYWLNDDDKGENDIMKVKIDPRQNPFNLVQMLTLAEKPIRSSKFAFAFVDGVPTIFAKNDLHMRFYDASGRFVDLNREYIDERVSQKVSFDDITFASARMRGPRLAPAVTTKTVMADLTGANTMKWYRLQMNEGEMLRLQIDKPATVQIFSSEGDEVYSAQGFDAVKPQSIVAENDGYYFLALHDLADDSEGTEVTLQYDIVEKYAVLTQDIATVGNGGPSTVTFTGNGFNDLTSVELKQGATTVTGTVLDGTPVERSVKFALTAAAIGEYDVVFHFPGKDVTIEGGIIVEEAVTGDMATTADFARRFLVATGNDYVFRLKNPSNMTVYDRPLTLLVYAPDAESIESVTIDGTVLNGTVLDGTVLDGSVLDGFPVENPPLPYCRSYAFSRTLRPSTSETLTARVVTNGECQVYVTLEEAGGLSEAVSEMALNDIYGYADKDGNTMLAEDKDDLFYTIQFGNDGDQAATTVTITDQFDPQIFDLTSFAPRSLRLGDKTVDLSGEKDGTVTFTMQPNIYALARAVWSLNETSGLLTLTITSLSPLTLRPVTEAMDGVLPVNSDGNGMGRFTFDIRLKDGLTTGTEIENQATVTLNNAPAEQTPTWTNYTFFKKGDVDRSGKVDVSDYIGVANHILGITPNGFMMKAADVNGDGNIDVSDYIGIANIILTGNVYGNSNQSRISRNGKTE